MKGSGVKDPNSSSGRGIVEDMFRKMDGECVRLGSGIHVEVPRTWST